MSDERDIVEIEGFGSLGPIEIHFQTPDGRKQCVSVAPNDGHAKEELVANLDRAWAAKYNQRGGELASMKDSRNAWRAIAVIVAILCVVLFASRLMQSGSLPAFQPSALDSPPPLWSASYCVSKSSAPASFTRHAPGTRADFHFSEGECLMRIICEPSIVGATDRGPLVVLVFPQARRSFLVPCDPVAFNGECAEDCDLVPGKRYVLQFVELPTEAQPESTGKASGTQAGAPDGVGLARDTVSAARSGTGVTNGSPIAADDAAA